jgi:hypothetical protein
VIAIAGRRPFIANAADALWRAEIKIIAHADSPLKKRIKSFCGARPTQKLRWSERGGGWLRRSGLWNFQAGIGAKDALGGAIGRRVAAVG